MVAVQLAPSGLLLTSVCFAFCIFIQVAQPQQLVCANDLTNEGSCYSERQVICNNYTDSNRDCLSQTIHRLSYASGDLEYTVLYGNSLAYSESSFEVVALKLCHKEALELTLSDVACAKQCTSRKYDGIADSFIFSCDNLPNLIYRGLTIVVFRTIENRSCSDLKTKFVVIDTRDVNECQDKTYNCSENALCNDKECGYSCICQPGYQMEDDNYTCAPVDCGAPPPVLHGNTTTSGTVFQSVATYTCDNGYNLDGDQTLTCESNAMWSGDEPECRAVDCGNLSTIDNGMVNAVTTTFTSVANYTCDNGYDLIGPSTRVCQANRSWSEMEPFCEVVDCRSMVSPSHSVVHVQETTFQSVVTYSCISGYSLVGDDNRTCQANGNWSGETPQCNPVDCGALPPVIHGNTTTSGTIFQSVATYFCDNGYNLVGNQTRICESNATWSGDKPECKAVDCGDPGTPINGEVDVPATTFQSEAYYACNPGYVIVGMNRRLCKANGSWSGHLPFCQIVDCGALDPPLNGTVSVDETVYESIAMYTCDDGYILMGERHRLCLANGSWSNEEPMCKPVDCGPPPAPTNGSVLHKQTVFQSIADYSCHVGYTLVGRRKHTCEAQGVWSGETPTCNAVDCGQLEDPKDGEVVATMTTFKSITVYVCNKGYILNGSASRTCRADGQWSGTKPSCTDICMTEEHGCDLNVSDCRSGHESVAQRCKCKEGFETKNEVCVKACQKDGNWSQTATGCMASISCPQDYQGNITRLCGEEGIWQNADNSSCKNIAFINFRNEVAELFESEVNDDSVGAVLFLVERLDRNIGVVNLTSDDLKLAVDILNKTVDFLTQHLETGGSDFSNQSVAVVNTMDQLLDVDMLSLYEQSNDSLGVTLLQSSEGYINYLASAIRDSGTAKMSINMNNIELEALVLNTEDEVVADIYYPEEEPIPPGCHHLVGHQPTYTPRVKIPYQLVKERGRKLNSTQVPAGNAIIKNIEQLLPLNRGLQRPVTSVISSQVSGDVLNQSAVLQDEPVSINFIIKDLFIVVNETAKCVFWKFSNNGNDKEGQWSSEGVTTKVLDNGVVQCNSTHLTSFTVIVAINDFEIHPAYEYLTYIGVGVSLVCLFMTIIFFLSERKTLFSRVHYFVHLNLAIALFSAYLIFAVGTHFGAHKIVPCTIVAALLHFLFLAAFCWMLCEGVMLYLMLVVVFSSLSKKWWFFLILGWGPPVIFVAAGYTYGAFRGGYVDINTCWLANGGTRWFFIGPMIAIIVINVVFLVIVIGSLCKNGSKDARKQMDDKGKNVQLVVSLVKASIILLPLLGTTWIFGLFALDEASSYVFGSLFIICSSLQGLFIFIFHVLRSERVWGRIKKKYGLFGSTQSHSVTQQSMFKSSRNASVILDKKDNGLKNLESKPQHADTSGPVVLEEEDEFDDGNDNCTCEAVNLEMNGQDSESSVNIDNKHGSSLSIDAKDNSHY